MRKIKLIIFDMDGVLVDAKLIHWEALNLAIKNVTKDESNFIKMEDHLKKYDGLPTKTKLKMLVDENKIKESDVESISNWKQFYTLKLCETLKYDEFKCEMMKRLKSEGYKIYVASNSIRDSITSMLYQTGIIKYVDYYFSNNDVKFPKPNPEIYQVAMTHAKVSPLETLIVEDSVSGRKAALESGAYLCAVDNTYDVTYDRIKKEINKMSDKKFKWDSNNINVVIPMAGAGSRFQQAGYTFPKPLIEVNQKPMIQVVVENLNIQANFIFIVQKEHYEKYNLGVFLNLIAPNCKVVIIDGITEGAACTVLKAKEYIDNDYPLIIANSDQFVEWDSDEFYYTCSNMENLDGNIVIFEATHPKWSYAKLNNEGNVILVAEKEPISNLATVGIYYYKKGNEFVKYATQMIDNDIRHGQSFNGKGEFYVCPIYNEYIKDGKIIKTFKAKSMWGLGTPEDLQYFTNNYSRGI